MGWSSFCKSNTQVHITKTKTYKKYINRQRQIQNTKYKDKDKDTDKYKDKDKDKVKIAPNICYIFEKPRAQGCQI